MEALKKPKRQTKIRPASRKLVKLFTQVFPIDGLAFSERIAFGLRRLPLSIRDAQILRMIEDWGQASPSEIANELQILNGEHENSGTVQNALKRLEIRGMIEPSDYRYRWNFVEQRDDPDQRARPRRLTSKGRLWLAELRHKLGDQVKSKMMPERDAKK
jgi:DNA-binding MarR family transcriptional regulator